MYNTQLRNIYTTTLVTSINYNSCLANSLVVGLNNIDIRQSSLFGKRGSPKIIMQNNTNDGIKIIDFSNL